VDGDGDTDVISASYVNEQIFWYRNNGGTPLTWTAIPFSNTLAATGERSVFATDVNGDGDMDVLYASEAAGEIRWHDNDGAALPHFTERTISLTAGSAFSVFPADVDGDGDTDVLSASADGGIRWYQNSGTSLPTWIPRVIPSSGFARSVFAADLDGDGDTDVLSPRGFDEVAWYENNGATLPVWVTHTISTATSGPWSVFAADVDGDGDLDALSASDADEKIAWYENRSIHRSATFPAQTVITTNADGARSVSTADVDGDGDTDAISAAFAGQIAWHANGGGSPPSWTSNTITTSADGAAEVHAADVDGDGKVDVLFASQNDDTIAWYRNTDGAGTFAVQPAISVTADMANSVYTADLDRDGDPDVLSASAATNGTIVWYQNPGWVASTIDNEALLGPKKVRAADIDRDGHIDVLGTGNSRLAWYKNNGARPPVFSRTLISTAHPGFWGLRGADVDGDGDTDVLATAAEGTIAWYENDGTPGDPGWAEHLITDTAVSAFDIAPVDADDDGDIDVFTASGNLATNSRVAWYENDGASPPGWTARTISTAVFTPFSVHAADLDGDGDVDALSASSNDDKIAWYENRGGQYAFATQAVVPATVTDGLLAPLLRIDLVHRGRSGDPAVALSNLAVRFEESPGDPLSAVEANALIAELQVYLDDGSGAFEASADTVVATVTTLVGGTETIVFPSTSDPRLHVAQGTAKSFFVVADLAANASSQTPHQFRAVHLATSSAARDASSGRTLRGEYSPDVATAILTAAAPDVGPPAVQSVFPPAGAVDIAPSTSFVLVMSESVDPATATPLSVNLSVGGLKVPGEVLVSSDGQIVTFDPAGVLALDTDYVLAVTGGLRDLAGNGAIPFSAGFDTANTAGAGQIDPGDVGDPADEEVSGAVLEGADADDHFGFSVAAVGDVNQDGVADLVVGSPNANVGANVDAGEVRLVFGGPALQSNATGALELLWTGSAAQEFAGETVARAGDLDDDGIADFVVGAPRADLGGPDAGVAYVVFGDPGLDELAPGPLELGAIGTTGRGVVIVGDLPGDLAGAALSYAGDLDGDGDDDLLVGAPGASPGGRIGAGKVYLVKGPLCSMSCPCAAGVFDLGTVTTTACGIVFHGENAGDAAGSAVSWWEDGAGPDDLLIGAPGASVLDEFGAPLTDAGYLYAIHGGSANLDAKATAGAVIELSRVANGQSDQVDGVVFLGATLDAAVGRSVTGAADVNDDGIADVLVGADNEAWLIPGNGPKTISGSSPLDQEARPTVTSLARQLNGSRAAEQFGATVFTPGSDGVLGDLTVGPAGDVNDDGIDDFIIGAAGADPDGRIDAGKAYIVYGRPVAFGDEVLLSEVGVTVAGLALAGAEGMNGAEPGDGLGGAVSGGFDLTGDGVDDALVGAQFADAQVPVLLQDAGQAYVISPVAPGEVVGLTLGKSGGSAVLEWTVPHRALVYNVYRGLLSVLRSVGQVRTSDMTQLACEIATDADLDELPDTSDATSPPVGNGYLYLVTAENLSGEGPLGPPGAVPVRLLDAHCP
jgi:hypothetical protein